MKKLLAFLAAAGILAAAPSASANGRFPESNHFFFSTTDTSVVLLRTTFGLLVSRDRGASWGYVCEKSIGSAGVEDPMYAVTPSGTMIATTFQGVTMSSDKACSWSFVGGALDKTVFVDLSQSPADEKTVVTFASSYDKQDDAGNILFKTQLFETKDEGKTFAALPYAFDQAYLGETVDLAATDPNRVYVSAVKNPGSTPQAFLLVSTDHGVGFTPYEIPLVSGERAIFIAGVDPKNADRVFLRTSNAIDKPSRLIVTEDAGKTFKTVLTSTGALLGFAISPDGTKVWAGGPSDGVQMASMTDLVFASKSSVQVQCLAAQADGLWACSNEKTGFIAGISTDDGATFTPKLHFCGIKGALDCPAGTPTTDQCTTAWTQQAELLGCIAPTNDGGLLEAGPGIDAGVPPGPGGSSSSCSCRTTPASPYGAAVAALGAAVALLRRKRRFKA